MMLGHQRLAHFKIMAAGAAHAGRIPGIQNAHIGRRDRHGADQGLARVHPAPGLPPAVTTQAAVNTEA